MAYRRFSTRLRARRAPTTPRDADAATAVAVIDRALTPIRNSKTT